MQADNPNQNPAAPDPDPAAPPQSVETQLQAHVAALEAKAAEHYDALLRAKAEGENIRKRAQEDIGKAHKYAVESFAQEMIPVRDSLEMALATMATPTATLESLRAGVELTLKQLTAAFEKSSLREVNPLGEKFDPNRHQAIATMPSAQPPGTVVEVRQKGYLLAERLVRPAFVTVAKAAESDAPAPAA